MLVDPLQFLMQTVNFLVLAFLLYKLLYAPVKRYMEQRQSSIERDLQNAREERKRAEELQSRAEELLTQARQQAEEIVFNAESRAERLQEKLLAEAQERVRALEERARQEISREKVEMWEALRAQVVDLAVDVAGKIIQENLDTKRQEKLVEGFLSELEQVDATLAGNPQ